MHNPVVECICQSSAFLVGVRKNWRARAVCSLRPGLENLQLRPLRFILLEGTQISDI